MVKKKTDLLVFLIVLVVAVSCGPNASAEFIGGTERFDGTVKDLAAWEERTQPPSSITQDDALRLTGGPAGAADFTTRIAKVPVGGGVRAKITINSFSGTGRGGLMLTTNNLGTTGQAGYDSFKITLQADPYTSGVGRFIGWQNSSGSMIGSLVPQAGTTYIFEMERLTSNSTRHSVYDAGGSLLGELPQRFHSDYTDDLFVALYVTGGAVDFTFDDVQLAPEPSSLVLAAGGALGLLGCVLIRARKRRRRH